MLDEALLLTKAGEGQGQPGGSVCRGGEAVAVSGLVVLELCAV